MIAVAPVVGITVIPFPIHTVGTVTASAKTAFRNNDVVFFLKHFAFLTFFRLFLSYRRQYESFRQTSLRDRQ